MTIELPPTPTAAPAAAAALAPTPAAGPVKGAAGGMALHTRILLGLIGGALFGLCANLGWGGDPRLETLVRELAEPVGQLFLRLMTMVVVPLVFCSLVLGVADLRDLRRLGRIGLRTLAIFLATTALAAMTGLFLVNLIRPGVGLPEETRTRLMQSYGGEAAKARAEAAPKEEGGWGLRSLLGLIPKNPVQAASKGDMLGVIFFALALGAGLTRLHPDRSAPLLGALGALGDAMVAIIDFALRLAPIGVAALIFSVTARFGFALLGKLGWYVATVGLGLLFHQFVAFGLMVRWGARLSPRRFFSAIETIMLTAFSTSSSNATLPTTMRVTEEQLGVPREICGFVLPLGATMNMNGTALFEGVTVLFLAQVFGVSLSLTTQISVICFCVLTAIGAAGVPGGTIPLLMVMLETFGIPAEGIAIILGVDRLLDMCRTTLNVTGDVVAAAWVARSEGFPLVSGHPLDLATRPE